MDPSKFAMTPQQMQEAQQQLQQQQQQQQGLMQGNAAGNLPNASAAGGTAQQQPQQQFQMNAGQGGGMMNLSALQGFPQQQTTQTQAGGAMTSQGLAAQQGRTGTAGPVPFLVGQSPFQQQLSALQGLQQQPQRGGQQDSSQQNGDRGGGGTPATDGSNSLQQTQDQQQQQTGQIDQSHLTNATGNNNQGLANNPTGLLQTAQGQQQQTQGGGITQLQQMQQQQQQQQPNSQAQDGSTPQMQPQQAPTQMSQQQQLPQQQSQTGQTPSQDMNQLLQGQGQNNALGSASTSGMPGGFNQNALLSAASMSGNMGFSLQQIQQLQLTQQLMAAGLPTNLQPNASAMSNPLMMAGLANPMVSQYGSGIAAPGATNPMASLGGANAATNPTATSGQGGGLGLLGGVNSVAAAPGAGGGAIPGLGGGGASATDPINAASKTSAQADWAEPFAGKGKKEPPFPLKLHQILSNPEFQECICWNPHGRSWRILKPPVFEQLVIPLYFRHAKYASFMRQVNGWGFKRIVSGNDHNSYFHELFLRDYPQLCLKMKRIRKGEKADDENSDGDDKPSISSKVADPKAKEEEPDEKSDDEHSEVPIKGENATAATSENAQTLSSLGLSTGTTGLATAAPGFNALASLQGQLQHGGGAGAGVGPGIPNAAAGNPLLGLQQPQLQQALQQPQQAQPTLAPLGNTPGGLSAPANPNPGMPGATAGGIDNTALLNSLLQQQQQPQQPGAQNTAGPTALNLNNLGFLQQGSLAQQLQVATQAPTRSDKDTSQMPQQQAHGEAPGPAEG